MIHLNLSSEDVPKDDVLNEHAMDVDCFSDSDMFSPNASDDGDDEDRDRDPEVPPQESQESQEAGRSTKRRRK